MRSTSLCVRRVDEFIFTKLIIRISHKSNSTFFLCCKTYKTLLRNKHRHVFFLILQITEQSIQTGRGLIPSNVSVSCKNTHRFRPPGIVPELGINRHTFPATRMSDRTFAHTLGLFFLNWRFVISGRRTPEGITGVLRRSSINGAFDLLELVRSIVFLMSFIIV